MSCSSFHEKYSKYHYCIVRECENTSIKTPGKLWIIVPRETSMRNTWLKLANKDPDSLSNEANFYFCEDHFHLENDMENYMEYKIMGSIKRIRMKPNCIPSRFDCQNRKQVVSPTTDNQQLQNDHDYHREAVMSTLCDNEVSECKEKWKNLQYSFVQSLKANSDGSSKKKYYLHNELEFVSPHLKQSTKAMESLEYESYEESTDSNEDVLSSAQEPHYAECIETPQLSEPPEKKVKSNHTDYNNPLETTCIPGKEDLRKMFLLSLLPEVAELTEPQMRSFRRGVFSLLDDISQRGNESTLSWESNTDMHHDELVKEEPL